MGDIRQVSRTLALALVALVLVFAATLHARETRDSAVRDAILRALPRYQFIPVDAERKIERVERYLDDELILHLSDGSTYRVIVQLRSR